MNEKSTTIVTFGIKIRDARKVRKWSQDVLADEAGVSRPTIARIERGDDVSTATLAKVAAALEMEVELRSQN